jgi:hypothetical protein
LGDQGRSETIWILISIKMKLRKYGGSGSGIRTPDTRIMIPML